MSNKTYRVGEGANLEALPRGTKVGEEIRLSQAVAMYEVDMGRLVDVEAEKAGAEETAARAAAAEEAAMAPRIELQPGEADGIEKTPVEGDTLTVSEDEAIASKSRRR
ncbi:hypothetical protein [Methylobacterium sp. J-090]|uniref:hypothetical protein n=1 Tax=Methylobacterium sp. J-090 TaxID=2836666 RepID=UPI001FBBEA80|nr:hypothetical protein [Methylobacterium sp. J-090]MCJ2080749.1 hypothetical protein [Methylobacterium sp. J-090]